MYVGALLDDLDYPPGTNGEYAAELFRLSTPIKCKRSIVFEGSGLLEQARNYAITSTACLLSIQQSTQCPNLLTKAISRHIQSHGCEYDFYG
jgi:hypothetical protein